MSAEDRHLSPYSFSEKVKRMLWAVVQATVFRFSFHTWNHFRIALLNCFGASVHHSCIIRRTVRIECPWNLSMCKNACLGDSCIVYCLGKISIGERASISQHAHLCAGTHDYTNEAMPLLREPITIGQDAWVAADAFVGPGVTIGAGAILGARSVAMKDVDSMGIYVGNPAAQVKTRPPLNMKKQT